MKQNILTNRFGHMHNPADVQEYMNLEGYDGLEAAVKMGKEYVLDEVERAALRGRGGAAYPAGRKWCSLYKMPGDTKYIVCNADEGEPGTFKDKAIIDFDPLSLIEGMTIAGYVFGAHQGYIYIRGEYRQLHQRLEEAMSSARSKNLLGNNIMGIDGFNFDIRIISGAGAYVCGESSALLNSIEGKTGRPRVKPPHLAEVGLYLKPTLVNNVETYANIPFIAKHGGQAFVEIGTPEGGGTKLVCLTGHVKNRGLFEVPLGTPLNDILYSEEYGGGSSTGRTLKFVHFGGQSGAIGAVTSFDDIAYSFEDMRKHGLTIGSGALVVMDESVSMLDYLVEVARFFAHESCGKCTPCRLGTTRVLEMLQKFQRHEGMLGDKQKFEAMVAHITQLSACGLGQSESISINSGMEAFPKDFDNIITPTKHAREVVHA